MKKSRHYLNRIKDIFSYNTNFVVLLSFFTLLSIAVFVAWYMLKYLTDYTILAEFGGALTDVEKQAVTEKYIINRVLFGLLFVPVSVVTFVAYGGCKKLVVQKLFGNFGGYGIYFLGVKSNAKYSAAVGIVCALFYNVYNALQLAGADVLWQYVVLILYLVVIFPVSMLFLSIGEIYHGNIWSAAKNSFVLYLVEWHLTCPLYLLFSAFVVVIFLFDTSAWVYVWFGVLFVYGFGVLQVLECSYNLWLLDKYVNKTNYPELYMKGLPEKDK